ncbi:twin-arginine translocation signal domain-containing protein [Phototrophicus methaneseepsis]|uniref:Twin-arginine translocation signal domain-containing protein n=1 Tax=Phototrophicus methaneseepsis TaxID=2710758 RepID=A0A7S8IF91_9CHLR|nr:ABC transporter substrate-binding protein [Phototrophicus methaneseepsis]QPC83337.1 twin-arginine translocation signal domain-containing protein [Phototrophicus methaneseepsis]
MKITRRTFLKMAGATAAATAFAPGTRFLSAPAIIHAQETITIGINAWVTSLDAQTQSGPSNVGYRIYGLMHDSLLQIGRDGQPEGLLATAWENDGNQWRFTLREGVVFHDGTTMTADDVVFSLERMMDPQYQGIGLTVGPYLASVEATDELEITITTPAPDPLLPYRLANYWVNIMPRAGVEAAGFDAMQANPIGAGPYKVVEFTPDRLVLEQHSEYWGGTPAAGEIILRYIPENAIRVSALQAGEVDMITNVPIDQLDALESDGDLQVVSTNLFNFMNVLFNTTAGVTADVNVRRALSMAIDRQAIVDQLFGGRVRAMTDYLLPGTLGFDESRPVLTYDPEAAAAALAESSYNGELLSFTPPVGYYVNSELVTQVVNQMWQAIGVNTELAPMEMGAYGQAYYSGAVSATIQSLDSFGDPVTSLLYIWTAGSSNFFSSFYYPQPAEFDESMATLSTAFDPEIRTTEIRKVISILERDMPFTPIYQTADYFAMRQGITWQPHPLFYVDLRPNNFSL